MIHSYNERLLPLAQRKLGLLYELAVNYEYLDIDAFSKTLISSRYAVAFEKGDAIYINGKSANEILALILGKTPQERELTEDASKEYWVGYVLAYVSWYYAKSIEEILSQYPASEIRNLYSPYHEMDILQVTEVIGKRLYTFSSLKKKRLEKGYSQSDLSLLSNVPIRNIRAYEQGSVDISVAEGKTLYALAKTLNCSIEELIS